ncbi:MAG: leucyl aminopeptidase [Chloroflexaceae bacterium]|nr:leucyl aminopeptidase [Chloroflexaceae bacterium]
MEIMVKSGDILGEPADLAVLASPEEVALPAAVAELIEGADFRGKAKQTRLIYPRGAVAPRRLLLLGLGKPDKLSADTLRQAAATAVRQAQELQVARLTFGLNGDLDLAPERIGQALAEGFELGAYRFQRYRSDLSDEQRFVVEGATIVASAEALRAGVAIGQTIARGANFARDLVNTPPNDLPPARLADQALALGQRLGLNVTVLDRARLVEGGFGGVLAVGQGSANEPRFIVMEYGAANQGAPTICLVGKGLTFDSGGLSLKPADAMTTMKSDMSGAAAVLGALQVAAELQLPLHVVGIIPAVENMPGGAAFRPDDVITTLSGKTVEVLNTDAEGRIVLADGLHYAQRYKPDAIIELSTLTGAIVIALGSHAIGMMATNQELADRIARAGEASGERVWQLPLWDEYREMIKSEIADMKNIGGRPAGSITAAAFLANFVGDYPFVHLDIAGTAFAEKPARSYDAPGATGVGVRLLSEVLRSYGTPG